MTAPFFTGAARLIDAIPVVPSTAARDARYANHPLNFRVQNLETGTIQRYTGAGWVTDVVLNGADYLGWVNVTDPTYGAVASLSVDSRAAFAAALAAAAGGVLLIPPGSYRMDSALPAITSPTKIVMFGASLYKYHTGDLMTISAGQCQVWGGTLRGATSVSTTYGTSGRAIYIANGASTTPDPHLVHVSTIDIDLALEVALDSGSGMQVTNLDAFPYTDGAKTVWLNCVGEATARPRHFAGLNLGSGYMDIDGAQDTFITNHFLRRIEINAAAFGTQIQAGRWGNLGAAMTIGGLTTMIYGVSFSGDVTIDAACTGVFHGNLSGYTLVNNAGVNVQVVALGLGSPPLQHVGPGHFGASTTAQASLKLPHGTAPTSPVDGEMWTTSAGLFVRVNGATVGPLS